MRFFSTILVASLIIVGLFTPTQRTPPVKSTPLSLPWGKKLNNNFREIPGFKYWYGDLKWGSMIFLGDFLDLEAEVQLTFAARQISEATLILGPRGLNDYGCRKVFKNVVQLITQKYGKSIYRKVIESEMKEELVYSGICRPIRVGLYEEEIHWTFGDFHIAAMLFGDELEIFIEISYTYIPLKNVKKDSAILKKL